MSDQEKEAPNWPPLPLQVSPSLVASDWAVAVCYHLNGSAGGSEVVAKGTGNSNDITKALRWAKEFASQRMQWWCHKETLFSLDDRLRRTFWTHEVWFQRGQTALLSIFSLLWKVTLWNAQLITAQGGLTNQKPAPSRFITWRFEDLRAATRWATAKTQTQVLNHVTKHT